jgi:GTP-binding protein
MSFTVAIVGRPNVGKSTLFNRLVGKRLALVDDTPGVTRARREGQARLGDLEFRVIDTAGLDEAPSGSLSERMRRQTEAAIAAADVVLLLIDARAGPLPADRSFADLVRKSAKHAVLLANKSESRAAEAGILQAFELGLGEPVAISAEHGEGLADLYAALQPLLPVQTLPGRKRAASSTAQDLIHIAVVGRPNTGKSTLINRIVGEERLLTGAEPGITRDAIAIDVDWHGRKFRLHDTAGLRRRSRIEEKLEKLSVADALNALRFAQVVILLLD